MPTPYRNILAVVNNQSDCDNTILKAITLSIKSGARLTFLSLEQKTSWFAGLSPFTQSKSPPAYRLKDEIDRVFSHSTQLCNNILFKQSQAHAEHTAVLQELNTQDYDLVIKQKIPKHHNYFGLAPSSDWHLLRETAVPVMLVTDNSWQVSGDMLTALETEEDNESHHRFNLKLLSHSCHLSTLLRSEIHLLNCYLGESMSIAVSSNADQANRQKMKHWQHLVDLSKHEAEFEKELHLRQGMPDQQIPALANKYQVNMVVLGSGEHNNMFNRIAGHTAEYVIDQLSCDVLALKPANTAWQSCAV